MIADSDPTQRILALVRLVTVTAIVAFLALTARDLVHLRSGVRNHYTIEVTRAADAARTDAGVPRIDYLVADGVLQRAESLARNDGWSVAPPTTSGLPSSLAWQSGDEPSRVEVDAESFLVLVEGHRWPGVLRVLQGDRELHRVELAGQNWVSLEVPSVDASMMSLAIALALFTGAAWWIGPFRQRRSCLPWLAFSLSALHLLVWISHPVAVEPDSPIYLESFATLLDGAPAYFPPGYPLLLGGMTTIFGGSAGLWLALAQHVMVVAASVWIFLLLRRLVPEEIALLGGFIAGALASTAMTPQWVMSEAATLFAMTGGLYFGARSAEDGRTSWAVIAGMLTGWAITMRAVPLFAVVPGIALLHLVAPGRRWRSGALAVGVAAVVTCLPVGWFVVRSGELNLANSSGLHLFNRVMREQNAIASDAPATRELVARLRGVDPRGLTWWDAMTQPGLAEMDEHELERLFWHASVEAIQRHPVEFAGDSARLAWRELTTELSASGEALIWGATAEAMPALENRPPLRLTEDALRWREAWQSVSRGAWPILCWMAIAGSIAGVVRSRSRVLVVALLWVPLAYLLVSASLDEFTARHNIELTPFIVALAVLPAGLALDRRPARFPATSE